MLDVSTKCPSCHGSGWTEGKRPEHLSHQGFRIEDDGDCEDCAGTGEVQCKQQDGCNCHECVEWAVRSVNEYRQAGAL
jgi:RecJ-like exonuclease